SIACDAEGVSRGWEKGNQYDAPGDTVLLCRCGHSNNKPYCDGKHASVGFQGRETPERETYAQRAKHLRGKGLDLLDDESLCVVARFCDKGDSIWNAIRETDDPEVLRAVVVEACDCPGGRLTAAAKDGKKFEPDLPEAISLINDPSRNWRGPLWVKGGIPVKSHAGEEYEVRNRVALCRCGESSNMPFCDATHYSCPHMEGQDE
ncbi:MAG: CDGSH iron-sulfur domain-containing protein, partial [Deltaproteobacteria bacterium]|nr:CDGSH iron-sulfur domain-containing protein [Deltaproteobacteria bacterium]